MDKNERLIEYARILRDTETLLESGWPVLDNDVSFTIPVMQSTVKAMPGMTAESIPNLVPGNISGSEQGSASETARNKMNIIPLRSDYASLSAMFPIPEANPGMGSSEQLNRIEKEIYSCEKCNLCLTSGKMVPGYGMANAQLMIVTAPPVNHTRESSSPLTAREMDYLNKWLIAMQLDPDNDVFITPSLKCVTPGGRPPHPEETAACAEYLRNQYKFVAPRAILALGDTACGSLTGNPRDFASLVAKKWSWGSIPALILWTPAEVLAFPNRLRRPVWEALQKFRVLW